MSKAQQAFDFINDSIKQGKTVFIVTSMTCKKVNQKTVTAWEKAGVPLFKIDSTGALLMGRGKNYDCICTPGICLVRITAQ